MSPVPALQVRLRSWAYERPGSLQPKGCPSSGPEGLHSQGQCEELSNPVFHMLFPTPDPEEVVIDIMLKGFHSQIDFASPILNKDKNITSL